MNENQKSKHVHQNMVSFNEKMSSIMTEKCLHTVVVPLAHQHVCRFIDKHTCVFIYTMKQKMSED